MKNVDTVDPLLEVATEEGRMLQVGDLLLPEHGAGASLEGPLKVPFAARFQGILIVVLLVGMILVAQRFSKQLYQIGLPLLVVAAFAQIAFGNIPPVSGFRKSMGLFLLTWAIIGALVYFAIQIAPVLIDLGRQQR
jgi:hypothetical protein